MNTSMKNHYWNSVVAAEKMRRAMEILHYPFKSSNYLFQIKTLLTCFYSLIIHNINSLFAHMNLILHCRMDRIVFY